MFVILFLTVPLVLMAYGVVQIIILLCAMMIAPKPPTKAEQEKIEFDKIDQFLKTNFRNYHRINDKLGYYKGIYITSKYIIINHNKRKIINKKWLFNTLLIKKPLSENILHQNNKTKGIAQSIDYSMIELQKLEQEIDNEITKLDEQIENETDIDKEIALIKQQIRLRNKKISLINKQTKLINSKIQCQKIR
ncbi:hypothetical protein FW755_00705 [Lonepinella koalarum]|uniref:hypothetical protein n=1 Tax=Lonepinella koalarum TaxID=53417 RepID=UPI0011E4929E|nr:hypothetical protein [Lonepinella koalarum]TYG33716.1 hypothetical protein FW755_00705 [Lonepinella koalarum]